MDVFELLKFATSVIKPFNGQDAGLLPPFIKNIELVNSIAPANLESQLVSFLLGRLEGKAHRVCVDCNTVDEIIHCLKTNITGEPSEVIEARIEALQLKNMTLSNFAKELENLVISITWPGSDSFLLLWEAVQIGILNSFANSLKSV